MAQIKLADELHARLKAQADANFRSIGGQIEYLLSLEGTTPMGGTPAGNTPPVQKTEVADLFGEKHRSLGEIMNDIRGAEADRDEELRFCQDPNTRVQIQHRWDNHITLLWGEWRAARDAQEA